MIYYWLHVAYIYFGSFFWSKVHLEDDLSRTRRVSILDCEAFRYMSNAKYFYYMDLIRFEILFRSKLYENTFKKGIYPVLGSQKIIYKKPLKRWTIFKITLKVDGWDDKWVYHKQVFSVNDVIYAIGITKVAFWKNKEVVNMRKILAESGIETPERPPSNQVLSMFESDYEVIQTTRLDQGISSP